jgi:serine/threonine-protein kinase HipA
LTLARMIGINVPAIDLVDVKAIGNLPSGVDRLGDKAFVIERFDRRDDGSPVHVEDFAQVYGVYPEDKSRKANFRNIASVIATESDHADVAEFVRRLTFNTLIGNADMHLKNWSLTYPDQRRARLSPAYDFVSTIPYIPGDQAALPRKLVMDTARETVELFMERWRKEKAHLPMGVDVVEAVDRHLETLPIVGVTNA